MTFRNENQDVQNLNEANSNNSEDCLSRIPCPMMYCCYPMMYRQYMVPYQQVPTQMMPQYPGYEMQRGSDLADDIGFRQYYDYYTDDYTDYTDYTDDDYYPYYFYFAPRPFPRRRRRRRRPRRRRYTY